MLKASTGRNRTAIRLHARGPMTITELAASVQRTRTALFLARNPRVRGAAHPGCPGPAW
jgi:hypothetical protein